MTNTQRELYKLDSLDKYELEHKSQDLRGHTLVTPAGAPVGKVDDMLVDKDRERVAALRLEDDRMVDIDYVDIRDGKPVLLVPQERVPRPGPDFDRNNLTSEHIPIIEERLEVAKRPVETGHVRVRSRVVEEPVRKEVEVRDEHVDVERRPVNERVSQKDAGSLLQDRDVEFVERGEKVVAGKEARVTEEVVVSKEVDSHKEQVADTVRRTEVDVERDAGSRR